MAKFWRSLTTWIVIAFMKSDWHVMPNYPSKLLTRHSVFWWRVWLLMGETDPASQWLTHQDGINGMMDDIMRAIEGRSWWIKKMDYHMGDKYLTYYCDIIVHVEQIFFTLFFSCTFCICLSHFHSYCTTVVCNMVIKMIYIYIYISINPSRFANHFIAMQKHTLHETTYSTPSSARQVCVGHLTVLGHQQAKCWRQS